MKSVLSVSADATFPLPAGLAAEAAFGEGTVLSEAALSETVLDVFLAMSRLSQAFDTLRSPQKRRVMHDLAGRNPPVNPQNASPRTSQYRAALYIWRPAAADERIIPRTSGILIRIVRERSIVKLKPIRLVILGRTSSRGTIHTEMLIKTAATLA